MVWLPDGEKILKISFFISTACTNVTDGQTDERTDRYRMTAKAALDAGIARQKLTDLDVPCSVEVTPCPRKGISPPASSLIEARRATATTTRMAGQHHVTGSRRAAIMTSRRSDNLGDNAVLSPALRLTRSGERNGIGRRFVSCVRAGLAGMRTAAVSTRVTNTALV